MTKDRFFIFTYLSLIFLLYACAQVVSPSGGEKDVAPPIVIEAKPANESNHFNAKEIRFQFDEFVKLNQLNQQLIVSPPLKHKPKTQLKGKTLSIEIKDTLQSNTTYVMNFGEAIVDITENNPISNFQYVFTTGKYIDSLELNGRVQDAFSLELKEDVLVMLYKQVEEDSLAHKYLPSYLAKTNKSGRFQLTNIAEGDYKVVALKDANSNFLFDRADEEIAFKKEPIHIPYEQEKLKLFTFLEASRKQFIDEQVWKENQLILAFKKPVSELKFGLLDTNTSDLLINFRISSNKDTAFFWFKELDNQWLKFNLHDEKSFLSDTLKLKFDSISSSSPLKLISILKRKHHFFKPVSFQFNRPIKTIDTSLIKIMRTDSSVLSFSMKKDSVLQSKVDLYFAQEQDSNYIVQFLPNAFIDIYSRTLKDTMNEKFSISSSKDYGLLEVNVEIAEQNAPLLIQLLDDKGNSLISKPLAENVARFVNLKGGTYGLKLIADANSNGRWDTGNYYEGLQAEKTFLYNEKIQVRSNWDKEIKWIIH